MPGPAHAFVTGASGFIGGVLVRRLVRDGWSVAALARSADAAATVAERGAEPVRGDLDDTAALQQGMAGADVVFHAAAHLGDWGDPADFERVNVQGTRHVVDAARRAGVRRVVHVGTEAALLHGQPLVAADERTPLAPDSPALYSATKARAEAVVLEAGHGGLETVVVRPRFVWGAGDTTLLPVTVELVRSGRFAWVAGGRQRTSTTHVDNVVEGLALAATRGTSGGVWFVTDGPTVVFREFVTALLATQGVEAPGRSVPLAVARAVAGAGETAWRCLRIGPTHRPPVTRFSVWVSGLECTLSDARARRELAYAPVVTHEEGLAGLVPSAA